MRVTFHHFSFSPFTIAGPGVAPKFPPALPRRRGLRDQTELMRTSKRQLRRLARETLSDSFDSAQDRDAAIRAVYWAERRRRGKGRTGKAVMVLK